MSANANRAILAMRQGDFAAAVRYFDKLGKVAQSDNRLAKAAGFAHMQLGDDDRALTFLNASLRGRAAQADVHAALGDIYVRRADEDKALSHLRRALALASEEPDLHYKLGLALIGFGAWDEAADEMRDTLALRPQDFKARLGLARVHTELGQYAEAEAELQHASSLAPDNYAVAFRLGKLREKQQRFDEAIVNFKKAEVQSEHAAPVCEALALAELAGGDPDAALATFSRGLRRSPSDTTLLGHASELRYEMGDPEAFSDYETALKARPVRAVHAKYITSLILAEHLDDAELQLHRYATQYGKDSAWLSVAAHLHYARGAHDEMLSLLGRAPADNVDLMTWKAQALLGCGDAAAAELVLADLLKRSPRDQFLVALLSTCYRLNDRAAYEELVDYDNLLIRTELSVPTGFDSLASFNAALRETLEEFHVTRANPLSQSVIGGTQTPGNLLQQPHPVIAALKASIHATLSRELGTEFYQRISHAHPVSVGKGHAINLPAAWSIWVTEGGYHRSHVHSKGWYSSAYYVSLPHSLRATDGSNQEGALAFGEPGVATPELLKADKVVAPAEGVLTLFPSYFWHGTLPFHGSEARVVVAFDALPVFV